MVPAILLFALAIAVGAYEGRTEANLSTRIITGLGLLAVSNLLACWPYFVVDVPSSWPRTFVTGLLFTGWVSLIVHVAPFLLAWRVAKWARAS
jgi:hypothetical protein